MQKELQKRNIKNNPLLLSTKHVLPADLEPVRPISFFHISCFRLFFGLCWLCMYVLVLLSFSSLLLFISSILLFLVFCLCLYIPLYSCHLSFLESSFIFLSFSSHLQSLLSSGLDFNVLFSLLNVALCWFFWFSFIQRERRGEEEGESPSSIMKPRWPDR